MRSENDTSAREVNLLGQPVRCCECGKMVRKVAIAIGRADNADFYHKGCVPLPPTPGEN